MGRYSVKRYKTKRRTRDLDLIYNDLSLKDSIVSLKNQPLDELKTGLGQYYCIPCAKYFENQITLDKHVKAKKHKRRLKDLSTRPYSRLEAEAVTGLNMEKFNESVAKYKAIEQQKNENREEYELLVNQQKPTLDEIMGIAPVGEDGEVIVDGEAIVEEVIVDGEGIAEEVIVDEVISMEE